MIEHKELKSLTELLMLTGQLLLENGAETFRVESSIIYMYRALGGGGEINVVALGTQLTLDICDGEHHTAVKRIRRRGVDLEKFACVNDVSRMVSEGRIDAEHALALLNGLDSGKFGNKAIQVLATAALVSGMFVFMIGGGAIEAVIAFAICLMVQTCWAFIRKSASLVFVAHIFSGFLIALLASAGALILDCNLERIMLGTLLPLFPGVAMIIAIRDTINGDLTSGVARGVEAVLTAAGLALGASLGLILVSSVWGYAPDTYITAATDIPYAIFALLVSFGSGLMLDARVKTAAVGAVIGGIVYAVFLLCGGTVVGVFVASLTLAALSETAARVIRVPSTLFLITGVYPLVPGAGIYKTAALILQNDVAVASVTGNKTMAELLFMVAGIAIVSALFNIRKVYQNTGNRTNGS